MFLVISSSLSSFEMHHATLFWPVEFLLKKISWRGDFGPLACASRRDWSCPLVGGLCQGVCLKVGVGSGQLQSACLLIRRAVFPLCWLFSLRCPSTWACTSVNGAGSPCQMVTSGITHSDVFRGLCHQCSWLTVSHHWPSSPEDIF